jgi:hypothetical protein
MASLFRELSLGHSKRDSIPPPLKPPPLSIMLSKPTITTTDLGSPPGQLGTQLSDSDLRSTAYEIFVAVCRTSSGKPLTYTPNSNSDSPTNHSTHSPNSPALQRSLTSAAASKMKKALGLKSPGSGSKKSPGSGQGKIRRGLTVGELMRAQMRVSETVDSRIRRALLRIAAGQVRFYSICFFFSVLV